MNNKTPTHPLVKEITNCIKELKNKAFISMADMEKLGFKPTGKQIHVSNDTARTALFIIHELSDEDNRHRKPDFCLLYSVEQKSGLVLNKNFDHFKNFKS